MNPGRPRASLVAAVGAVLGVVSVAAGAMGAHALRDRVEPAALEWWKTAAHYALVHAVMITALGVSGAVDRVRIWRTAAAIFVVGIVIFAGTLFAMTLGGPRWLGAITPLGGLALLGAWAAIAVGALQYRSKPPGV